MWQDEEKGHTLIIPLVAFPPGAIVVPSCYSAMQANEFVKIENNVVTSTATPVEEDGESVPVKVLAQLARNVDKVFLVSD